ncbi:hypothetical protein Mapa_010864 [Marchantia paleacea]|nr:hypothetical protein Mapa_010864 [Marchantia paleacea]
MKFNVCGGLDAPDWILAHMSTLSKISAVRIKVLAKHIIDRMLEGVFDYEKVLKLSKDSSLGESEVKACIAVLHFFVANAAKFDVDDSTLSKELQQLGLPKEHSDALCTPYLQTKDSLQAKFLEQALQIPAMQIGGWQVQVGETKNVIMRLTTTNRVDQKEETTQDLQLCLTAEKFHLLLHELKTAKSLLEEIS